MAAAEHRVFVGEVCLTTFFRDKNIFLHSEELLQVRQWESFLLVVLLVQTKKCNSDNKKYSTLEIKTNSTVDNLDVFLKDNRTNLKLLLKGALRVHTGHQNLLAIIP